jgi:hypothetical protein
MWGEPLTWGSTGQGRVWVAESRCDLRRSARDDCVSHNEQHKRGQAEYPDTHDQRAVLSAIRSHPIHLPSTGSEADGHVRVPRASISAGSLRTQGEGEGLIPGKARRVSADWLAAQNTNA